MSRKLRIKMSARLLKRKMKPSASSKKKCRFCSSEQAAAELDYKNTELLKSFLTERGKILPSRVSGNSSKCQRMLSRQIKLARSMALLPYCSVSQ